MRVAAERAIGPLAVAGLLAPAMTGSVAILPRDSASRSVPPGRWWLHCAGDGDTRWRRRPVLPSAAGLLVLDTVTVLCAYYLLTACPPAPSC